MLMVASRRESIRSKNLLHNRWTDLFQMKDTSILRLKMEVRWTILIAFLILKYGNAAPNATTPEQGTNTQLILPCAEEFTLHEGVCYKGFTTQKTWEESEAECNKLPGGHLAAFHSREEFNMLTGLMG